MTQQIPLPESALIGAWTGDGTWQVTADVAWLRVGFVNVGFIGSRDNRGWLLVDAGLPGSAGHILQAAAARFGGERPAAILLTHGHFDHVGALPRLLREWNVPVYAHTLEMPYLDGRAAYPPADTRAGGGLMTRLSWIYPRGPYKVGRALRALPDDGSVPEGEGWRWIHTPGHSVGHVSFWRDSDRMLMAGDAFVTTAPESAYAALRLPLELHGPPRYFTPNWGAARESVGRLAALSPAVAVTGHGRAVAGPELAAGLRALADKFDEVAVPKSPMVRPAANSQNGGTR